MAGPLIWIAVGGLAAWVISRDKKEDSMYQCGKEIKRYHNEKVTLGNNQRTDMRHRRNSNRSRLKVGLDRNEDPASIGQWTQGSYAMRTMIQKIGNKYDIDDGVYFSKESLKSSGGTDKTALGVRNMVRDALDDGSFKRPPKLKKNCVRVYYDAGFHVDVPVYRTWEEENLWGDVIAYCELASADWKESDPLAVTQWFKDAVKLQSPQDDTTQFRRVVRYMKKFTDSRESWSDQSPSGLTISKLVQEKYVACSGDDEQSLHKTMKAIRDRLVYDLRVEHPAVGEPLAEANDSKTQFLLNKLTENLKHLEVLESANGSKAEALRAWKKVFNDDFFENLAVKEDGVSGSSKGNQLSALNVGLLSNDSGQTAVNKEGGGRFA